MCAPRSIRWKEVESQESLRRDFARLSPLLGLGLIEIVVDDQSRNGVLQLAASKRVFEPEETVTRADSASPSSEVELVKTLGDGVLSCGPYHQIGCPHTCIVWLGAKEVIMEALSVAYEQRGVDDVSGGVAHLTNQEARS